MFLSHTLFKSSLPLLIEKLATKHIYLQNSKFYTQISKKLCYKTRKGLCNFSKISSSQNYPYSLPFFQKYHNHLIYSPFFHHLLRLIIFPLSRKVIRTSFFKIQIKSSVQKREPRMILIHLLKRKRRKEVKKDPNLVGYGRFQCLVAFERFHCLVIDGRFQCLVANGRRKRSILFTLFHFPPNKFHLNILFFH